MSLTGDLEIVCAVTDPFEIKRYWTHVNIDHRPPPRGPPRIDAEELLQGAIDFDQRLPADD